MRRQPGDGRALTAQVHPEPHPEARVEVARIRQAWLLVPVTDARCVGRWLVCTLVHVQTASYSKTKEGAEGAAVLTRVGLVVLGQQRALVVGASVPSGRLQRASSRAHRTYIVAQR